ncbi:unnamed protein product [Ceratitis capitata]|uniref:(Mediterranean fruit fly) hypothetical protein n=1 Tax=Ceratitis capitata TaxID=7213 RepID=A0A811U1Z9_CERCA|nr:unnamed protein product [Ceratitis capitata]
MTEFTSLAAFVLGANTPTINQPAKLSKAKASQSTNMLHNITLHSTAKHRKRASQPSNDPTKQHHCVLNCRTQFAGATVHGRSTINEADSLTCGGNERTRMARGVLEQTQTTTSCNSALRSITSERRKLFESC